MAISTRGRYALSYLIDLASHENKGKLSVRESAKHCGISEKYLEQIVSVLSQEHIIKSVRGPRGGYYLLIDPNECTVGQILRLMEGNLSVAPDLEDTEYSQRLWSSNLILWKKMDDALNAVIDTVTIADMCNWESMSMAMYV